MRCAVTSSISLGKEVEKSRRTEQRDDCLKAWMDSFGIGMKKSRAKTQRRKEERDEWMVRMEGRTTEEGKKQKSQVKKDLKSNTLCNTVKYIP